MGRRGRAPPGSAGDLDARGARQSAGVTDMLIGYARVSTADQNLDLQHDALAGAGCEKVFEEKASGARDDRPGLTAALSHCRPGDVIAGYKLDLLGPTIRRLVELIPDLAQRKSDFHS